MHRTRIKICGVTNVADALLCAEAGADAIGLIFYSKSARCIDAGRAREIISLLPAFVTPVAVFVDAPVEDVRRTCSDLRLRHVQLHGHESVDYVRELNEFRIIKVLRVERTSFENELTKWKQTDLKNVAALLLETAAEQVGGTGIENDWATIETAQRNGAMDGLPPTIAAGGLHAGNVADVVRRIRPWAVDAVSGTEEKPGKKSAEKVRAFVHAVSRAD